MGSTRRQDDSTDEKAPLSRRRAMFRAASSGVWEDFGIDDYNPEIHTALKCGEPSCPAPIVHIKAHFAQGSDFRPAHFASKNREDHIPDCRWIAPELEAHPNSVTLTDAIIDQNSRIIVNLNWPLGSPVFGTYGRTTDRSMDLPYNVYRQQHTHATISVKSPQEYLDAIAKIERVEADLKRGRGSAAHSEPTLKSALAQALMTGAQPHLRSALKRTLVSHIREIRFVENFDLGTSPLKYNELISQMVSQWESTKEYGRTEVQAFPRYISFRPGDDEKKHLLKDADRIDGTRITLKQRGYAKLIVINCAKSNDDGFRQRMLTHDAYDLFAVPMLNIDELKDAQARFNGGRTGHVRLYWQVNSDNQFQVAKDASPIFRPHPRLVF